MTRLLNELTLEVSVCEVQCSLGRVIQKVFSIDSK